jgi:hypothetical protein
LLKAFQKKLVKKEGWMGLPVFTGFAGDNSSGQVGFQRIVYLETLTTQRCAVIKKLFVILPIIIW